MFKQHEGKYSLKLQKLDTPPNNISHPCLVLQSKIITKRSTDRELIQACPIILRENGDA